MPVITLGIGDLEVSRDAEAVLVTHALGSCVAVVAWDPVRRAGGMLHFQLPASSLAPARARAEPGAFADTGIPLLLERLRGLGCRKGDLVVKAAGGGRFHPEHDVGERNVAAMREILRRANVPVVAEDFGGARSRTARLVVASGLVTIRSGGEVAPL